MVQPIKYYPDESININAGPMRGFTESYQQIVEDLVDTMKEHNLKGLSAIQIGYPYQLMVIKEAEEYIPYANPRIITQKEPFDSAEESIYFKNHPITVKRYQQLSIVYEDKNGDMKTKKIDNKEEASLFQRKVDYLFNGTLLDRLLPLQREQAIRALAGKGAMPTNTDAFCPPFSKKEYFPSVADKLLFFMFVSLILPLFGISKATLDSWYTYDKFAFPTVILIMIGFFFYAQYEAKQFKQCTSCQVGNNIGVIVKRVIVGLLFAVGSYFILG
jgi:peptide deformylase